MISESSLVALGTAAYWMGATGLFVFLIAESLWPAKPFRTEKDHLLHVGRNFGLWLSAVLIGNFFYGIFLLDLQNNLLETNFGLFHWLQLPFVYEFIIGIALLDLGEYIYHRLSHSVRWMWLMHAVHHSDPHLDVTTAMRFHPGEIIVNISWKVAVCFVFGLPLWYVGARAMLMAAASMIQHSNIAWPTTLDRILRVIFITPRLHRYHHSPDPAENNTNFGEIFSVWDRLFGTYFEVGRNYQIKYGLPRLKDAKWQTVTGLLTTPIKARRFSSL